MGACISAENRVVPEPYKGQPGLLNSYPQQPLNDTRRPVLIVWDIENVRLPAPAAGLEPRHVVRYLKHQFIEACPGRQEYKLVAAVTRRSLAKIEAEHPGFVDDLCTEMCLMLASATKEKRNADVVLKKELSLFTHEYAELARAAPRSLTVVLLSGDEDFLEPVQRALQQGFDVQLVHQDNASRALLAQPYTRQPMLWSEFLRKASGRADLVLPGSDEHVHRLLLRILKMQGPGTGVTAGQQAPAQGQQDGLASHGCLLLAGLPLTGGAKAALTRLCIACGMPAPADPQPSVAALEDGDGLQGAAPPPAPPRSSSMGPVPTLHVLEPRKAEYQLLCVLEFPTCKDASGTIISGHLAALAAKARLEAWGQGPLAQSLRVWLPWEVLVAQVEAHTQPDSLSPGPAAAAAQNGAPAAAWSSSAGVAVYDAQGRAAWDVANAARAAGATNMAQYAARPTPTSACSTLLIACGDGRMGQQQAGGPAGGQGQSGQRQSPLRPNRHGNGNTSSNRLPPISAQGSGGAGTPADGSVMSGHSAAPAVQALSSHLMATMQRAVRERHGSSLTMAPLTCMPLLQQPAPSAGVAAAAAGSSSSSPYLQLAAALWPNARPPPDSAANSRGPTPGRARGAGPNGQLQQPGQQQGPEQGEGAGGGRRRRRKRKGAKPGPAQNGGMDMMATGSTDATGNAAASTSPLPKLDAPAGEEDDVGSEDTLYSALSMDGGEGEGGERGARTLA